MAENTDRSPRIIVTRKGPIDRHQPGEDVTGLYRAETITRLVKEGYLRRSYQDSDDEDEDAPQEELPEGKEDVADDRN